MDERIQRLVTVARKQISNSFGLGVGEIVLKAWPELQPECSYHPKLKGGRAPNSLQTAKYLLWCSERIE